MSEPKNTFFRGIVRFTVDKSSGLKNGPGLIECSNGRKLPYLPSNGHGIMSTNKETVFSRDTMPIPQDGDRVIFAVETDSSGHLFAHPWGYEQAFYNSLLEK